MAKYTWRRWLLGLDCGEMPQCSNFFKCWWNRQELQSCWVNGCCQRFHRKCCAVVCHVISSTFEGKKPSFSVRRWRNWAWCVRSHRRWCFQGHFSTAWHGTFTWASWLWPPEFALGHRFSTPGFTRQQWIRKINRFDRTSTPTWTLVSSHPDFVGTEL